ncbi:alpha/beta fold hydrolase [Rathayibacter sp. CAU 1779]
MSARPTPTASSARQPAHREASPHTVEVDGSTTAYWEYGAADAATTLVLVHGFRGDHHGLEPIAERLTEFRVIVPDLPGFGASDPLSGRVHDIDGYAAWLGAFIAAVRPTGRFVLLGHSFGSIVVSAMLGRADAATSVPDTASVPESARPDLVVLVNPIGAPALRGPRAIFTRLAIFYYWLAAALPESLGFGLLRNPAIVRVMSEAMAKTKDRRLRAWIHGQHAQYFSAFAGRAVVLEAFRASVSHDVSEYASAITEPVLLIAADRDDITPIAAQRRLQTLFPDARLHVVDGVGHLVHYEAPDEAADQVRAFVAEHGAAA